MPIFEFECLDCGKPFETLMIGFAEAPLCKHCGSPKIKKRLSAHSSMSGLSKNQIPRHDDTACCGSSPGQAAGCAGPGSCCGKNF